MSNIKIRYKRTGKIAVIPDYYARTLIKIGQAEKVLDPPADEAKPKGRRRKYKTRHLTANDE